MAVDTFAKDRPCRGHFRKGGMLLNGHGARWALQYHTRSIPRHTRSVGVPRDAAFAKCCFTHNSRWSLSIQGEVPEGRIDSEDPLRCPPNRMQTDCWAETHSDGTVSLSGFV